MKILKPLITIFLFGLLCQPALAQEEDPPWEWSEDRIENAVNKVRAGRNLNPDSWPGGARVAVLLSFDVDNETIWLRNGDTNVGGLSLFSGRRSAFRWHRK
jgi:hypothetical protein